MCITYLHGLVTNGIKFPGSGLFPVHHFQGNAGTDTEPGNSNSIRKKDYRFFAEKTVRRKR